MATQKVSEMAAAVSVADADLVPVVQGGINKKATVDLILDALTGARVATAIGSTAANLVYAGPATGAAAVPAARSLVAADIPSLSAVYLPIGGGTLTGALVLSGAPTIDLHAATKVYVDGLIAGRQPLDATLTALAALGAGPGFLQVTGADTFAIAALTDTQINTALGYTAANAASLNPANLSAAVPTTKGGTGLTTIGTGLQVLRVNAGATALEFADAAGGISGLTAGVIPVATSGTAIGNSKWTMSGANGGTATLYDPTVGSGLTSLVIRAGDTGNGWATKLLDIRDSSNNSMGGFVANSGAVSVWADDYRNPSWDYFQINGSAYNAFYMNSAFALKWSSGGASAAGDIGLARSAAGILKVTDGSTGFGSLRVSALGAETANGAISNVKSISESITLSTAGATTDSTADLLPANAIIKSVVARITTTITTATDWAIGDATTAARFAAANSTLTAGTTAVGVAHRQGSVATDAAGPVQIAAAKLRITTTGTPGAGVIRVTVFYEELTPPTS